MDKDGRLLLETGLSPHVPYPRDRVCFNEQDLVSGVCETNGPSSYPKPHLSEINISCGIQWRADNDDHTVCMN